MSRWYSLLLTIHLNEWFELCGCVQVLGRCMQVRWESGEWVHLIVCKVCGPVGFRWVSSMHAVKEHRWNGWFRINKCECNPIRPLYGGWCNISCYFIVKQSINLYNHLLLLHILFETYSMHSCTCPYVECSFGHPLSWCLKTTV